MIGLPDENQTFVPWKAAALDVAFCMSSGYTAWDKALSLMARARVDLSLAITHREPLDNWKALFEELEAERGIKGLFLPYA